MAGAAIPANKPSISQGASTPQHSHKGSTSFFESMSPWSTGSHNSSAGSPKPPVKEAKACAALVEEVFRPDESQKAEMTAEAPFLPRLLDRVGFSMWSSASTKNLDNEVQKLRGRQSAAARLLDEVEKETEYINQQLQEKTKQAKLQGHKGFFGLACTNCGPSFDVNEINMQATRPLQDDVIELRPILRSRVKECEEALVERDAELRQLRHEIQLLRGEKEMLRQVEKDAVLDGLGNSKNALVQRYGAAFNLVDGSHVKVVFHAWRHYVQRRALREKMVKTTSLALASDSARQKSLLFAYWQTLVRDKRDAQKLKKERQRLTIGQSYAAKFAMQADSTAMRAIIMEWWRVSKEGALQAHLAAAKAKQDATCKEATPLTPLASTQKHGAATDKACCTLM